jgi:diacylglycerol kinase family enzyme
VGWLAVVLNDSSGKGECESAARRLKEIFDAAGRESRITVAHSGEELQSAMRRAVESGCDTLVAGGGDGTINTAAQALADSEIPLGVVPLGTLNHFAKDLQIPLEVDDAAQVVLDGRLCQVDVGEVNGHVFVNNSSLGLYPAIVRLRERYQATGRGKWIAALWAGLIVLRRSSFLAVRIIAEGQAVVRRTPFVFVGNNEYRMVGLQAASRDSLTGGHLALYVVHAERRSRGGAGAGSVGGAGGHHRDQTQTAPGRHGRRGGGAGIPSGVPCKSGRSPGPCSGRIHGLPSIRFRLIF